jgi:hypothetical protein
MQSSDVDLEIVLGSAASDDDAVEDNDDDFVPRSENYLNGTALEIQSTSQKTTAATMKKKKTRK